MTNLELRLNVKDLPLNVVPEIGKKINGTVNWSACTASSGEGYNWIGTVQDFADGQRVQVYVRAGTVIAEKLYVDVPYSQITNSFANVFNISVDPGTGGLNPFPTIVRGVAGGSRYNNGNTATVSVQFQVSPTSTIVSVTLTKATGNSGSWVEATKNTVASFDSTFQQIVGFNNVPAGQYIISYRPQGSNASPVTMPVTVNNDYSTDISSFTYANGGSTEFVYASISRMIATYDTVARNLVLKFVATANVDVEFEKDGVTTLPKTVLDLTNIPGNAPFTRYVDRDFQSTGSIKIRFREQGKSVWIERTVTTPFSQAQIDVYNASSTTTNTGTTPTNNTNPTNPSTNPVVNPSTFLPLASSTWNVSGEETISNEYVSVTINRNRGGAVTKISVNGGVSICNDPRWGDGRFDVGRQCDDTIYADPHGGGNPADWYREAGQEAPIGWNGVGPGNTYPYLQPSVIIAFGRTDKMLYVKRQCWQWDMHDVPCKMYLEAWMWLDGRGIRRHCRVTMFRDDATKTPQYGVQQEVGYGYNTGRHHTQVWCPSDQPFTNAALSQKDVFFGDNTDGFSDRIESAEGWSASIDDNGQGIGWYTKDQIGFTAGHFHDKTSDPNAFGAGYMTPCYRTVMDANGVYDYDYAWVVGSVNQIREWVYAQPRPTFMLQQVFNNDRHNWAFRKCTDSGVTSQGMVIDMSNREAAVVSSLYPIQASLNRKLYVRGKFTMTSLRFEYRRQNQSELEAAQKGQFITVPITPNADNWQTIELDLSGQSNYTGIVSEIKLAHGNYLDDVHSGQKFQFRGISNVKSDMDNLT